MTEPFLRPDWPAPAGVAAVSTTRADGYSEPPYDSFNLALHVGDDPESVLRNRARLRQRQSLPREPVWLDQVHSARVVELTGSERVPPTADASFTREPGVVCAVLTADCLPVLFCDRRGTCVGAAHAGWRGLASGVLEATVEAMRDPGDLLAWLGPAIGPSAFEVGEDVRDAFVSDAADAQAAFAPAETTGKYLADIYRLARLRLRRAGVTRVYGGGRCTFRESGCFFSFRRDGKTGRMASLIWRSELPVPGGV